MSSDCLLCEEPFDLVHDEWVPLNRVQYAHRECALREVMGGIGHHIAHEYWCLQRHDPDAGLTRRQSAKLVRAYIELLGAEEVAARTP